MVPDEIYQINTSDFIPAKKDSNRRVWNRDECAYFHAAPGATVRIKQGLQRGPGWYRANRPEDETGLHEAIGQIVSCVRMGKFPPILNENCAGCRFKSQCISEGFGLTATEQRKVEASLEWLEKAMADEKEDR